MTEPSPVLYRWRWIEPAMAAGIVVGIVYCALYVARFGYLPPPFFFEPSDTFADWFNTAYWARAEGAYDTWKTIYLPLSFVALRLFGIDRCYPEVRGADSSVGLVARDCDWVGLVTMGLIVVLNVILTWKTFRKIDRRTAVPRTICVALGMPMLNGIERGNLVILSYTCLILALGPLLRSARLRWLFAGLAINLKIYLVAAVVPLLLKRRWRWVESALIAAVVIYLVSYALFGAGTPREIFLNIRDFSSGDASQILDVWYTTTYRSLYSLLDTGNFPFSQIIGSAWVGRLLIILPLLLWITQLLIVAAAAAIWLRPEALPQYRAVSLGILLALVTSETGGYTQIYFMLFVMMEPWRGLGRCWSIIACYLLALPFDVPLDTLPETPSDLYFWGTVSMTNHYVVLGPFLRPLIVMTVAWGLALNTLNEVWRDMVRYRGAGRRRFRHDAALLPRLAPPTAPGRGNHLSSPASPPS